MKYFTPSWFETGCPPVPEYEKNFEIVREKLPKAIDEHFSLHDARVIRIQHVPQNYARNDIVLFVNTKHSYTKARRIVFVDAEMETAGMMENTWWIAEEFDVIQEKYIMEVMTVNGENGEYGFLTVKFKDLLIE